MNINSITTKDYRKNDDFKVRINKPNLVRRRRIPKMSANIFVTKDYENETTFRPKKQTQTKPISNEAPMPWADAYMGVTGDVVPNDELRKVFDLQFAILKAIVSEP